MRNCFTLLLLFLAATIFAQKPDAAKNDAWKSIYRSTPERINDLVNTKLDVSFDFSKSQMPAKAWITLHPHFYPTDSLTLDAHSFNINEVSVVKNGKNIPLKYTYDSLVLHIKLDRTYYGGENYVVYINYVARPNDIRIKGNMAINDAKGLYFINPLGKDKNKPTQVWTQGETESNSGWFPTIDKPNQKMTDEITMTVPSKYVTLSNGLLVKQKKNSDGTRTDTWKMDLPHAPYLVMMAVGDYAVVKDSYKGKEVSYYVEKEYEPVARKIFGLTPEMIAFYSKMTGVDYPWQKYSQVAVRNYVSGAMENTTATVHGDGVQQNARELLDGNSWEETIAHELFHMWFGDLVTTESWSNLTINESFATYGAMAWAEYKHGEDGLSEERYNAMMTYFYSNQSNRDLVRFYYKTHDEMFDGVSYQKGACILYMLRNFVGDSAFNKSLNLFLTKNKYRAVEAQELRLAFEEVTGKDLNWFFNQWFYGSGHPKLDISYGYDQQSGKALVYVKQNQKDKVFRLPVAVDIYQGGAKQRYNVWVEHQADTFSFPCSGKPDLVDFDGDKMLLCERTDHKSLDNYIFQYKNAGIYLNRKASIEALEGEFSNNPVARGFVKTVLGDKYFGLRLIALQRLKLNNDTVRQAIEPLVLEMAKNDPSTQVRAAAIDVLGRLKNTSYKQLFLDATKDSSYAVAGSGLTALGPIDTTAALTIAKSFAAQKLKGRLSYAVTNVLFTYAGEDDFDALASKFTSIGFSQSKFNMLQPFASYLKKVNDFTKFRKGVDMIVNFRDSIPSEYGAQLSSYLNGMILNGIASAKQAAGQKDKADYVTSKINSKKTQSDPVVELPVETLKSYAGEYTSADATFKISLKNDKTLYFSVGEEQSYEMVPLSKTSFKLKYMEEVKVEFTVNDKNEATSVTLIEPGTEIKADKKK